MSDPVTPVQLEGELSFATVHQYLEHSEQLLDGGVLDLSRVTHADSAGLALLLELTRRQRAKTGAELKLVGAASRIARLAEFFGLREVLRFQDGTTNTALPGRPGVKTRALHIWLGTMVLALAASGCAHHPADEPADPLESFNRVVFTVNDKADHYVLRPIAKGYVDVTPGLVRRGITNFFYNLGEPRTIVNDVLQGKFVQSAQDLARFMLDSTVGLAGFIDVATDNGLPRHDEDFGQTLGSWGVGEGWYLVLPLLGPSDNRDLVGFVGDIPLSASFWLTSDYDWLAYTLYGVNLINFRANLLSTDGLINQQFDKYLFFRTAYLQRRQALVYDGNPPPEDLGINDSDDAPAPPTPAPTPSPSASPPP